MTRSQSIILLFLATVLVSPASPRSASAQSKAPDAPGCKDHPLVTRMQNMRIYSCKSVEFNRVVFKTGKGTRAPIEGKRFDIRYQAMPAGRPEPIGHHPQPPASHRQNRRHGAVRRPALHRFEGIQGRRGDLDAGRYRLGQGYLLTIVEKQAMAQEVVASAELFQSSLKTTGHVEIPNIYFDTGKSELKGESDAAIAQIAKLLTADPALKVFVVGHTDNVSSLDVNTRLSQARAEAVVQVLVARHGIAAARLVGRGVGPLAPVASNDVEEGRARNRRVELVKQ